MATLASFDSFSRRWSMPATVIATALVAVVINLSIYAVGTLAGASFDFTANGDPAHVYAITLIGFTAIPLVVGLALVAGLGRWRKWVYPLALVVAPVLAIGTIFIMTLPVDLDTSSTVTLAAAHVVVAIAAVGGILALRARRPASAFRFA